MLSEIDKNLYCTAFAKIHHNGKCWYSDTPCDTKHCNRACHKWPTPDQFKAEYGEEYPDNGAVYVRNSGWGFMVENYLQAKKRLIHVPETEIICACTPWGKPPDDWRPE